SDISTPANRAKTFGLIGAAFGVGFIAGPMLGGVLGSVDYQLPFYVGAGLCFANAIFGYFFVEESLPKNKRSAFSFAKSNPFSSFRRLFARADIGALIIVFALASFAQILQQTTWVLYTHFKFGWGPKENGIALFLVGLTAAVVQAAMLPRLTRAMGEVKLSLIGMAVAVVAYFANGLASAGWVIYVLVVANFLSYAAGPALQAIVSKATDPREQGALMGSLQSLSSVSIVIAPIVSTVILAEVSHYPMSDWRLGAVFYLAAFLQLIGVLLAWRFFAQRGIPVHPANQSPPTPSSTTVSASS
ncbi:MAG: MFS transporter, partial [Burkholderiales bacterium]